MMIVDAIHANIFGSGRLERVDSLDQSKRDFEAREYFVRTRNSEFNERTTRNGERSQMH